MININNNETVKPQKNALTTLNDQVTSLITKNVIKKAKNIIQTYNSQTDAKLFEEQLIQICNMLKKIKSMNLNPTSIEFDLIVNEFKRHWLKMDSIVIKARQQRPQPVLTETDLIRIKTIKRGLTEIFGSDRELPVNDVVTFLVEATKE